MKTIVAGYGKFGHIAVSRLSELDSCEEIRVIDIRIQDRAAYKNCRVIFYEADIIEYLTTFSDNESDLFIIPTVPFHLAAAYLTQLSKEFSYSNLDDRTIADLPNIYRVDKFNVCCSYADFLCPDDCSESECCSVTGEIRIPMFEKLSGLARDGVRIQVVRSMQALPGVGGFYLRDLEITVKKISDWDRFVLATSCRCHAILTGIARRL